MKRLALALVLAVCIQLPAQSSSSPTTFSNPKVRAITGFVRLDRSTYQKQISDALSVLRKVKTDFESSGYEVETVRVTTQPLADLVAGLPEDQALAFLNQLDQLSVKENFIPNVGPAMLHDSDDPSTMHLLERALSTLPNIEASTIIADETGIHWKTIRRTSELVKYVSEHSPRSQGTFNFTATAMLKPYSPFFPGSYHTGAGRQFAIGFEGANVVRDVFAKDKGNADAALADLTAALSVSASCCCTVREPRSEVGNLVRIQTGLRKDYSHRGKNF